MRSALSPLLITAVVLCGGAVSARATDLQCFTGSAWGCQSPARLASRHDTHAARLAITSEDGNATLLITNDVVALQLSDRTFRRIDRRLRDEEDEDQDALGAAIKSAVFSSVRSMLAHSAECRVREIRSVSYQDGRLVFLTENGRYVFGGAHIVDDDEDTLDSFSERDAVAFVAEFKKVKHHLD